MESKAQINLIEFACRAVGVPFRDLGRDWSGWDCWGLVVRAFREVFGIDLPTYEGDYADTEDEAIAGLFQDRDQLGRLIAAGRERPGDVVVLRLRGLPWHVGLVIEPGRMLHAFKGTETCLDNYRNKVWEKRIVGIYRHEQLAGQT